VPARRYHEIAIESILNRVSNVVFLALLVFSITTGLRALTGKSAGVNRQFELPLFGAGWILLVAAGFFARDVMLVAVTFPSMVIICSVAAVLWRASAPGWSRRATACYWIGVLLAIAGAVHFGLIAYDIQCIERTCHGPYGPPQPHVVRDLVLWSLPAAVICAGLRLSGQFSATGVVLAGAALLLLNPAILFLVAWLQPPLGM